MTNIWKQSHFLKKRDQHLETVTCFSQKRDKHLEAHCIRLTFFNTFFLPNTNCSAQLETHAYCSTPDIVLCGNKADLEDKRQVSTERAKQFAMEHG